MCAVVVNDDIHFLFAHSHPVIFAPVYKKKEHVVNIAVFWDMLQCSSVNRGQRLG